MMDMSSLNLGPRNVGPDRNLSLTPDSIIPSNTIAVVDPVSTGAHLAYQLSRRGYQILRVWSDSCPDKVKAHTMHGIEITYLADVQVEAGKIAQAADKIAAFSPLHLMVGCETGVLCADQLAHALGLRGNGVALSGLRRNKFEQIEAVRRAGLDAPLQALASNASEVEAWLGATAFPTPFKAVVKPVEGAGSDGVSICDSPQAVRTAYANLEGSTNILGSDIQQVLLQEYLVGDEYVVDSVSADGQHKVVAIWKYDKRAANGAPVVYFGMRLLQMDAEPALAAMAAYVEGCLDAIGIQWGAMHSEVKLEPRGPVLVEVNCRLHGGEGIWLPISQACLGYTQVSAMCDAYVERAAFEALPPAPRSLLAHGAWVTIRSSATGVIAALRHARLDTIRSLASYCDEYLPLGAGDTIVTTVDACTVHGCFNLVHADAAQLERDYAAAQALVDEGLFEIDPPAAA